ncbi:hypothetical protein B0H15DRAFT_476353 [Mycena belliarum]|uniref:Uncharacterized protein n=1 Tax=Mycena belliarum TaxID=1033014 RepID=A0AAD6XI89_9AGAR|nr:hypothetical protein B0H15DRAFT_476353 [Mycena belliae]
MKSCLKVPSVPGSPDPGHAGYRKCVAFNPEDLEEVHWADEWDRTPTEPARKLSYQELLELKEITQSLPHAAQPWDTRPGKHILSTVPIGLLPLAASDDPTSPTSSTVTPNSSPAAQYQTPFVMPPGRARAAPPPARLASPTLTHLRPLAPPPRVKPTFSFLPLLPSPSPSVSASACVASATPTPASSIASSPGGPGPSGDLSYFPPYPPARAAADGEPDRVLPPPARKPPVSAQPIAVAGASAHGYAHAYRAAEAAAYSPPFGSSAYDYAKDRHHMLDREHRQAALVREQLERAIPTLVLPAPELAVAAPAKQARKTKKSFMLINDVEVEIEETDDEADEPPKAPPPAPKIEVAAPVLTAKPASPTPTPTSAPEKAPAPPSPSPTLKPTSPLSPTGRLSPVQARASSRLVRV